MQCWLGFHVFTVLITVKYVFILAVPDTIHKARTPVSSCLHPTLNSDRGFVYLGEVSGLLLFPNFYLDGYLPLWHQSKARKIDKTVTWYS